METASGGRGMATDYFSRFLIRVGLAVPTIGTLLRIPSEPPPPMLDVQECLAEARYRVRPPKFYSESSRYRFHFEGRPTELDDVVAGHIRTLEKHQIVNEIDGILHELFELERLYPRYVERFHMSGSWGDGSHKSEKPGHMAIDFKLNSRRFRLERFAGDPEEYEPGRYTYHHHQFQIFIDGTLAFRAREYHDRPEPFQNEVAVLDSHLDQKTIDEIVSVGRLNRFRLSLVQARNRRASLREQRKSRGNDARRLEAIHTAQRATSLSTGSKG